VPQAVMGVLDLKKWREILMILKKKLEKYGG
jgi:hypothetical protein